MFTSVPVGKIKHYFFHNPAENGDRIDVEWRFGAKMKNLRCKVHGGCVCSSIGTVPNVQLEVCVFGRDFDITKIVKQGKALLESDVVPFLCGERVYTECCRVVFSVSEEFAYDVGCVSEINEEFNDFLDGLFEKFVNGVECSVDGWEKALVQVVPGSWAVDGDVRLGRISSHSSKNVGLYVIPVRFKSYLQLEHPLVPKRLDFFERGFSCRSSKGEALSHREICEVGLGVLVCQDALYINKNMDFFVARPKGEESTREIYVRELAAQGLSVYEFAGLSGFLASDPDLKSRLAKYGRNEDFVPPAVHVGAASAGMFGGTLHRYYPEDPKIYVNLDGRWEQDSFGNVLAQFMSCLEHACEDCAEVYKSVADSRENAKDPSRMNKWRYFCGSGPLEIVLEVPGTGHVQDSKRVAFDLLGTVVERVLGFCRALRECCLEQPRSGDMVLDLIRRTWQKVELDPAIYSDDENPIVSKMGRMILSGVEL